MEKLYKCWEKQRRIKSIAPNIEFVLRKNALQGFLQSSCQTTKIHRKFIVIWGNPTQYVSSHNTYLYWILHVGLSFTQEFIYEREWKEPHIYSWFSFEPVLIDQMWKESSWHNITPSDDIGFWVNCQSSLRNVDTFFDLPKWVSWKSALLLNTKWITPASFLRKFSCYKLFSKLRIEKGGSVYKFQTLKIFHVLWGE